MTTIALRRVATYERVSSEDQRERETIKTQQKELAESLEGTSSVRLVNRYIDDGVSGTIPMVSRPSGMRLMADARSGLFDEVWVWRLDRLGRDDVDPLVVRRDLESLGVKVHSATEDISDPFIYHIHVAMAAQERRNFLARSAAGMKRAAQEGRYTGGIVPLGYIVEGREQTARLVPSDKSIWQDWTEVDLVRRLYHWLAVEGWSCPRIAQHLNSLGVPTAYTKDDRQVRRGQRKEKTQGCWWAGRILSIITNPVYKGELQYGRRSTKPGGREVISAQVPPLVFPEVWRAAQETLNLNRLMVKNTPRVYLLKSVMRCGTCGRFFIGSWSRNHPRYRCNGQLTDRRPIQERCQAKTLRGPDLEPLVWDDIERFLRDPRDILEELQREREMGQGSVIAEAEMVTLESALATLALRRKKAIDLNLRERISDQELDDLLAEIVREQEGVEKQLQELRASTSEPDEPLDLDLLSELRQRLDDGLTDAQRQEIVLLLVKRITVYTETSEEGKRARVLIQYRSPGVVEIFTGRGSGRPPGYASVKVAGLNTRAADPNFGRHLGRNARCTRLDPTESIALAMRSDLVPPRANFSHGNDDGVCVVLSKIYFLNGLASESTSPPSGGLVLSRPVGLPGPLLNLPEIVRFRDWLMGVSRAIWGGSIFCLEDWESSRSLEDT